MNLGKCAGAGVADHLHLHLLPRWTGDSNFMTVLGETRVQPEDLLATYDKLKVLPHPLEVSPDSPGWRPRLTHATRGAMVDPPPDLGQDPSRTALTCFLPPIEFFLDRVCIFALPLRSNQGPKRTASWKAFPPAPPVFALFPAPREGVPSAPYLGRTGDLRRRLTRLLSPRRQISKMLNLRELTARIEYEPVGSAFEGTWLLYLLNRHYFSRQYRDRLRLKPPALLKLKMQNRFPRCYPTRRMVKDGSLYYGPFPSMAVAERFAGEFLDFFKIRRCVEELNPDPSHPGCIYSQLHMCLAPCFAGCTDAEYQGEVQRVVEFLDSQGKSL